MEPVQVYYGDGVAPYLFPDKLVLTPIVLNNLPHGKQKRKRGESTRNRGIGCCLEVLLRDNGDYEQLIKIPRSHHIKDLIIVDPNFSRQVHVFGDASILSIDQEKEFSAALVAPGFGHWFKIDILALTFTQRLTSE